MQEGCVLAVYTVLSVGLKISLLAKTVRIGSRQTCSQFVILHVRTFQYMHAGKQEDILLHIQVLNLGRLQAESR
jgi:hypothetical protein